MGGRVGYDGLFTGKDHFGLRSFYKYCLLEQITTIDPTVLLEAPKSKT